MAPHGEEDGGDAQQQGEQALAALEAERQDGGDQEQRHQPVEPRRRQAEAQKHGRAGEQDGEDHEQDAEPPLSVRLPSIELQTSVGVFLAAMFIACLVPIVGFLIFQRSFLGGTGLGGAIKG